jgi:hypothetical protein
MDAPDAPRVHVGVDRSGARIYGRRDEADMAVPTLIVHGWSYFRRRGLRATVGTILSRFVYGSQQFVVYRTRLAGPPAADRVGEIVFRLATTDDVDDLDEFEPYDLGATQRAYVQYDKDWLFVACHGDRIVATRRYSRQIPAGSLISRRLGLASRQVWSADAFCLPEYRNQGLNRHFGRFTMRFLASQGYAEEFGVITASNVASLRSVLGRGSEFVYFVSYSRFLFYEHFQMSDDLPEDLRALARAGLKTRPR